MFLVSFWPLELSVANLASELHNVAVLQHVLPQCSLRIQPQATLCAVIFSFAVGVKMLREGAGSLIGLLADHANVALKVRVNFLVLLQRSFLKVAMN